MQLHFSLITEGGGGPSLIRGKCDCMLHILLGRDTTNLCHGLALMTICWPVIVCNGNRALKLIVVIGC